MSYSHSAFPGHFYAAGKHLLWLMLLFSLCLATPSVGQPHAPHTLPLAGEWRVLLDHEDIGMKEQWFVHDFLTQGAAPIQLPGSLQEHGFGDPVSVRTQWMATNYSGFFDHEKYAPYRTDENFRFPYWLTSETHYTGVAWYQRQVHVPEQWHHAHITLHLERVHWGSLVYVNGHKVGADSSLGVPHRYDLSQVLQPGLNTLTIRVDNRMLYNIGPDAHSITEHTQSNWNGIAGDMHLQARPRLFIDDLQLYPDIARHGVTARVHLRNTDVSAASGRLHLQAVPANRATRERAAGNSEIAPFSLDVTVSTDTTMELWYPMGEDVLLWDEFEPNVYRMDAVLLAEGATPGGEPIHPNRREHPSAQGAQVNTANRSDGVGEPIHPNAPLPGQAPSPVSVQGLDQEQSWLKNRVSATFGMREFDIQGRRFTVNGQAVFLRGTLESAIFPLTGYPATSREAWDRVFDVVKQYGLNHVRFHSWCPPRAAFEAADEAGVFLQPEASVWPNHGATVGYGEPVDAFIMAESRRILREYGNHPSFVMFAHGNEPAGSNQHAYLSEFVRTLRAEDARRVYTGAAGWPVLEENEFQLIYEPRIQPWGAGLNSRINAVEPSTDWDFSEAIQRHDRPVVGHEIGQWTVYPDFDEISKYTGVLKANNFLIFRDFLERSHLLHQASDFVMATGKLQVLCYKADIEAALRTPEYAGYQMLDIRDFPGQGSAIVGVVDPFWDRKPYVNAQEFRRFNSPTVPLIRTEKKVWMEGETLTADIEVTHFGREADATVPVSWRILDAAGRVIASGTKQVSLQTGNNPGAGRVTLELERSGEPRQLNLQVRAGLLGENDWNFWVYPRLSDRPDTGEVIVTDRLTDDIEQQLRGGARVLLNLAGRIRDDKGASIAAGFSTVFWNTAWTRGQAPHTMGILVDPGHGLFADFPTEYHSNWQWWDVIRGVQPMILTDLPPSLTPGIQMIETWFDARKLGLLFEASVGQGHLMVTSIDFESELHNRPATRQLYHSVLSYLQRGEFAPAAEVDPDLVRALYK